MSERKTFYLESDKVCTRLQLHANEVRSMLEQNGWIEVDMPEEADQVFVNTCAFLQDIEDKAVDRIEELRSELDKEKKVTVFGCLPHINPDRIEEIPNVSMVATREADVFADQFNLQRSQADVGRTFDRRLNWVGKTNRLLNKLVFRDPYFEYLYEKEKVFHLQIGEGCLGNCSYCAEKLARGDLKSRKVEEVVGEFQRGIQEGYRLFSFNSDDTGMYGVDNDENVAMLLRRVLSEPVDFNLVLTEFNPWGLLRNREEMLELLESPKVVFITVPIQSGSNRVLQRMRRPYKVEDVVETLEEVRERNRSLRINTHLIVGFPGETEEDFMETFDLIQRFDFNKIKVFEYSDRPNVDSYHFEDKVPEREIRRRKNMLKRHYMLESLRTRNLKRFMLNLGSYY